MVTINPSSYVTTNDSDGTGQSLTNFTLVTPAITTPAITGGTISNAAISSGTITNATINGGTLNGISYNSINSSSGTFENLFVTGATTCAGGSFTTLSVSSTVSGTGFTNYFASPPAIGGTTPADGTFTNATVSSGNLRFSSTGHRITGDFTNATVANRVMFQTSTADSMTSIRALPNGTSNEATVGVVNNSDPTNSSEGSFYITNTELRVRSGIFGTGTYLPMLFYTNNAAQVKLDTSGNLLVQGAGGLGYGSGSGGTVTQGTTPTTVKTNGVTINKTNGQIITNNATLNAATNVSFTVTNSTVAATDCVHINRASGGTAGTYSIWVDSVASGSFVVTIRNTSASNLGEALTLNFAVIKSVTA